MTTATELVAAGFSAGQAKAIGGQRADVSAAGSSISDATVLKSQSSNVNVTSVTSGQGVRLADSDFGDEYDIYNASSSVQLLVYPPTSSGTINQLGAGVAGVVPPLTAATFKKRTATAWTASISR